MQSKQKNNGQRLLAAHKAKREVLRATSNHEPGSFATTSDTVFYTQHETRSKLAEAHKLLSDIYDWFTEGFDTKDLQEAKMLLEELSH